MSTLSDHDQRADVTDLLGLGHPGPLGAHAPRDLSEAGVVQVGADEAVGVEVNLAIQRKTEWSGSETNSVLDLPDN